jgi:hypothetical protein
LGKYFIKFFPRAPFSQVLSKGVALSAARAVLFASGEQRPQHTSVLICERKSSHVCASRSNA